MPAFKKFGPGDQLDNVLVLEPRYELSSGSSGWRGSPNGSASLTLYGGARRTGIFSDIQYQSMFPGNSQTGGTRRSAPLTASINVVWMTSEELPASSRSSTRWGKEHWDVVQRLYADYSSVDPDYITGSYNFYSLYFNCDSKNIIASSFDEITTSRGYCPSASFTFEVWANPYQTGSATRDFTIWSVSRTLWFGITGSTGRLAFSSSLAGVSTSSFGPTLGEWSHVTVRCDGTSGSFLINLQDAGSFAHSGPITRPNSFTASFCVGNRFAGPVIASRTETVGAYPAYALSYGLFLSGSSNASFHGTMNELRVWDVYRTDAQISGAYSGRMSAPFQTGALMYLPMSDGPNSTYATYYPDITVALGGMTGGLATLIGSGTVDLVNLGSAIRENVPQMGGWGINAAQPVWLPCDNTLFYPDKILAQQASDINPNNYAPFNYLYTPRTVERMIVVSVPSAFYGRQIAPGSIALTCRAYSSGSHSLVRTLIDDSRGNLFISGSMMSGSTSSYRGVEWNKVGNVFYGEGLIVIRDQSLLDFGTVNGVSSHPGETLQFSFRGTTKIPVKTLMCRIDRGEFNCSANSTFYTEESDGLRVRSQPSGSLRVSTVGIYNSDRELVGVARLADPLRIRSRDRLNIKLRMDF